jgi:nucleoside-diphosphate-sugar epimerase
MPSRRVLFIGGTGILSRAAGLLLVERGDELTILNRGWSSKRPAPDGAERLRADVREPGALAAAIEGREFDVVVDFVAFTADDARRDVDLFSGRTAQYVFISSVAAYQKPPAHLPIRESSPLHNPFWDYGSNKIAAEDVFVSAFRRSGFPATIVRPAHTYDPSYIPLNGEWTAIDRMLRGVPVVLHGDGTSLWTLTHARDFAAAFVALLGNPAAIGDSFHITSDEILTWDRIAQTLARAAGVEARIVHVPSDAMAAADRRQGEELLGDRTYSVVFDNTKIKDFVPGWRATTPFATGAVEILDWYDAHPARKKVDPALEEYFDALIARYGVN